ncbi:MAG: acyltransferase family protein [Pseudomonadota bacterium]
MTPSYRADIDGLRAVAVLSIVLFHLGVDAFSGGYVGVDIFFVISGYLITSIIVRELAEGRFTLARFYERRVRRILPALIVVLGATLAAGLVLLAPEQLGELARSTIATSVFSSNIFFFAGTGYFDGPAESKPLLHTWSLAVEEQFYILFPLLLMVLQKHFAGRFAPTVAGVVGLSFVASILMTAVNESAAFYLIPFRAWELGIGSLLALGVLPAVSGAMARPLLASAGLLAILASVLVFTTTTPFPGVAAALPTLGTAAVIHAGGSGTTFVGRALSVRPMVFIGLISYSLYLWHWPVVVYAKHYLINEPTDFERHVILFVVLILAALSWHFVEAPFRDRRRFQPRARLFGLAGGSSAAVVVLAVVIVASGGLPGRSITNSLQDVVAADPGWQHWKDCEELGEHRNAAPELCAIGESGTSTFLLWGDSHALALASGINLSATRAGAGGLAALRTGCPPLLGIDRPGRSSCAEFNDAIVQRLQAESGISTVILAARWTLAADGTRYGNEPGRDVTLIDLAMPDDSAVDNATLFVRGLERTIDTLQGLGKSVIIIGQVPEIGYDVPSTNYSARLTGRDVSTLIAPSRDDFEQRAGSARRILEVQSESRSLRYIDPADRLCNAERCAVVMDGVPLYRDDNHLSLRGNVLLQDLLDPMFAGP